MTKKYKHVKRLSTSYGAFQPPKEVIKSILNFSKSLESNKTKLKFPLIHKN